MTPQLIEKYGLSDSEAEKFVSMLFETITQGLEADRQVKVKGLGTFKITNMSSRESVNVNTGERILIDSRDKISFTPDTVLRDRVNKPFAQFETFVLNDGVDFSEIDAKSYADPTSTLQTIDDNEGDTENRESIEAEEEIAEKPLNIAEKAEVSQPENNEDAQTSECNEEKQDEEAQTQHLTPTKDTTPNETTFNTINMDKTTEIKQELSSDSVQEKPQTDIENEEAQTASSQVSEKRNCIGDSSSEALKKISDLQQQIIYIKDENFKLTNENRKLKNANNALDLKLKKAKGSQFVLMCVIGAIIVVAIACGYYAKSLIDNKEMQLKALKIDYVNLSKSINNAPKTNEQSASVKKAKQSASDSKTQKVATASKSERPEQNTEVKNKDNSQSQTSASKYDADPRIRTGAYKIVGIEKEVVVKKGQTLESISRTYLGAGMDCYMQAVNNKELKEGDKVKIPKLELKKRTK